MTAIILSLSNLTVVAAVVIFLALTLLLVVILLVAKARLMPAGNRRITINGERTVETPAGATLLASLASNKIFLPSACGGGGSCGMCRCRVLSGGGEILPTETGFFTRKQQQEHYRLACQVKVKNDLQIQVPQPILGIKKMECEVVSNRNVASFIKEFVVRVPEGEKFDFLPGSYVQIDVPRYDIKFTDMEVDDKFRDEWDKYKMWGLTCRNDEETFRAYSMANYPAEGNIIMLNIRIATPPFDRSTGTWAAGIKPGICSSYIFTRKPGDKVTLSGPYGDFHIQDTGREMIYIGGGAGWRRCVRISCTFSAPCIRPIVKSLIGTGHVPVGRYFTKKISGLSSAISPISSSILPFPIRSPKTTGQVIPDLSIRYFTTITSKTTRHPKTSNIICAVPAPCRVP